MQHTCSRRKDALASAKWQITNISAPAGSNLRSACHLSSLERGAMTLLPPISLLTLIPLVGSTAVLTFGGRDKKLARGLALAFAFLALAVTLVLWHWFNPASGLLQFEELHSWIPSLGVEYHVGVDGLGLLMLLL